MSNIPLICSSPYLTCGTFALRIHKVLTSPPPHTRNRGEENTHYNHGASIGAWIHIPSPFLRRPYGVLKYRVHPTPPEKKWCRECDIGIELVVERTGEEHANSTCGEDSCQDVIWRYSNRNRVLRFPARFLKLQRISNQFGNRLFSRP